MIKISGKNPADFTGDMLVCLVEGESMRLDEGAADGFLARVLEQAVASGDFKGEKEQTFLVYPALVGGEGERAIAARRLLFVGLGKRPDDGSGLRETLRCAGGAIAKQAGQLKAKEVQVVLPGAYPVAADEMAACLVEGLLLGNYRFDLYKTPKKEADKTARVERFLVHPGGLPVAQVREGIRRGRVLAEATCAARDMANQPGNGWTPADFAAYAKDLCRQGELHCKILDRTAMTKLGMGGIIGVNRGSALPPRLVILEYRTGKKHPTVMLVGKDRKSVV